ncbi:MAG TPA: glucose-6-phosphate dehydrogenase assembly protein OpcA [Candidatus Xenobia bacterium]
MAANLTTPVDGALASLLRDTSSWKASGVHVDAIDKQLTRLWKDQTADGSTPVTRTRVLNLVCVTGSSDGAARIKDIVCHMGGQHPSRTIILVANPEVEEGESNLDAEIEGHRLRTGRASGDVSWELVTIRARGRTAFHLASVVNPLLITDLPTFLWWSGEPPFESELFARLLSISDRAMVDSLSFRFPFEKEVPRLSKLVRRWGKDVAFSDFNWARIRSWVDFTVQMFDIGQNRPYMDGIQHLRVDYEARVEDPEPNPSQAILYVSWVASRLGWTPDKGRKRQGRGWIIPMTSRHGTIEVEIHAADSRRCSAGEISAFEVRSDWQGHKGTFSVQRTTDRAHAVTHVDLEGVVTLTKTVEFEKTSDSSLLLDELSIFDRERAYEGALDMASAILAGKTAKKA